jgi:hypothetical protein
MGGWIEPLLAAASRAPSGDNTQPWRFVVEGDLVGLDAVDERDPSPMNAGGRMSRIAVGAALENVVRAAEALGLKATPVDPGPYLARVRIEGECGDIDGLDPDLTARSTNRRAYDESPLPAEVLGRLTLATLDLGGSSTRWLVGPDRLAAIAGVIGRSDALMFGNPSMRKAFLGNVRFDRPAAEEVDEGLSLASLELKGTDRLALRIMKRTPDPVLKVGGASAVFSAKARQLVVSSSGLCVVSASRDNAAADVEVGRSVQRAWLSLTAEGLSAQPMMSLPVLDNARKHGSDALKTSLGLDRIAALIEEFRSLVPELGQARPAWLMRFGTAPPPSGRTGRLPVSGMTSYHS